MNEYLIKIAKKASDSWRGTDTYHQAAQIIDMLVDETAKEPAMSPCDVCMFSPPSSTDGKPCCVCPAAAKAE